MKAKDTEPVEVFVAVHMETGKAILVSTSGVKEAAEWVPKSQIIERVPKDDVHETITIPEWLAVKRGFV